MTDATAPTTAQPSFGVGAILGETFSIFGRKFVAVTLLAFVPMVVVLAISVALLGAQVALGVGNPDFEEFNFVGLGLVFVLQMLAYGVATAMMVQLAYDAKLGRSLRVGAYVSVALRNILPLAVLTIAITFLASAGMALLILPGLWIYAVYIVTVPAIVIESNGFGGMGRSMRLTKGYRWPIIGLLVVLGIAMIVISFVVNFVVGLIVSAVGGVALSILFTALGSAITFAISCIAVALIYARLREIKEGVSVDSLADVFS